MPTYSHMKFGPCTCRVGIGKHRALDCRLAEACELSNTLPIVVSFQTLEDLGLELHLLAGT